MRWELVGYADHPVPDDPAVVQAQTDRLRAVAASLREQLCRMPTEEATGSLLWDSDAAEGFRQVVAQLPRDLEKLATRYERAADALGSFSAVLRRAKPDAESGVLAAGRAQDDIEAAQAGIARMQEHARAAQVAAQRINDGAEPGTVPVSPEPWTGPDHHALLREAERRLAEAREQVRAAVDAFSRAGDDAARAVEAASNDDLRNESGFWAGVRRIAHSAVEALPVEQIASMAGKIAAVAGVLSLLPIPGVQVLGAVALVAGAVAFAANAALVLDKRHRREPVGMGDWVALGLSGVGFAAGGAALALRGGAGLVRGLSAQSGTALSGAQRAASAATSARAGAQATHLANVRHLSAIRSSGILRRFVSRITGTTGTAERAVRASRVALDRAVAAERAALAQQAAAQGRHARHLSAQAGLNRASDRARVGGVAVDVGSETVNVVRDAPELAVVAPGAAAVHSVVIDVADTIDWFEEQGELDRARQDGARIEAQPIPAG